MTIQRDVRREADKWTDTSRLFDTQEIATQGGSLKFIDASVVSNEHLSGLVCEISAYTVGE